MGILTNYIEQTTAINIYDWSIRKVLFRHKKHYTSVLIGYVPYYDKIEIVYIKQFYFEQRLISEENVDNIYFLSGQSGLTDKAKKLWHAYKKNLRIVHEIDITNKYQQLDEDLSKNKLITRCYLLNYMTDKMINKEWKIRNNYKSNFL
jgi:hypothetical protein